MPKITGFFVEEGDIIEVTNDFNDSFFSFTAGETYRVFRVDRDGFLIRKVYAVQLHNMNYSTETSIGISFHQGEFQYLQKTTAPFKTVRSSVRTQAVAFQKDRYFTPMSLCKKCRKKYTTQTECLDCRR